MITAQCKKDLKLKSGIVIPEGTNMTIEVKEENPTIAYLDDGENQIKISSINLGKYFNEFGTFTGDDLQDAITDGACVSLDMYDVEPDGWSENGFPSILLALSLV